MDKKGWANARDHYGHSALHKSVMANQGDIMKFLLHHHPEHIEDRDNVSSQLIECLVGFQISLAGNYSINQTSLCFSSICSF